MMPNKFSTIFFISFVVYFILDYIGRNAMLYITGGIIGGSIDEIFRALGINAKMLLINLAWLALLIGLIVMFFYLNNYILKYTTIIVIAAFLYVIDIFFADIAYSETVEVNNITLINHIIIGFLILLKSCILSLTFYFGIISKLNKNTL